MTDRFRAKPRALDESELMNIQVIKEKAEELSLMIEIVSTGRFKETAIMRLEEAIMWAVKGMTA